MPLGLYPSARTCYALPDSFRDERGIRYSCTVYGQLCNHDESLANRSDSRLWRTTVVFHLRALYGYRGTSSGPRSYGDTAAEFHSARPIPLPHAHRWTL